MIYYLPTLFLSVILMYNGSITSMSNLAPFDSNNLKASKFPTVDETNKRKVPFDRWAAFTPVLLPT